MCQGQGEKCKARQMRRAISVRRQMRKEETKCEAIHVREFKISSLQIVQFLL